ncbi:hypothetical protein [uncultured Cocleimonas sp.]|uniref:hypothetical protein n=1 Tax=uncultured Cocleimonas sp. TaxID=1051587 RepID=UPI002618E5FF|nr:hypothetical protein [uncultured Cocleimonas sp.]
MIVNPNVCIQSAIDGHDLLLANPLLQDECERGDLVELFSDIRLDDLGIYLIYKELNYQSYILPIFNKQNCPKVGGCLFKLN